MGVAAESFEGGRMEQLRWAMLQRVLKVGGWSNWGGQCCREFWRWEDEAIVVGVAAEGFEDEG